jgi:RHS repeat-associated protein
MLEDRTVPATVTWINAASGDWDTRANWSTGSLPGATDDVVINTLNAGASITHTQNITDAVNSITAAAPLTLSGGTLSVAGNFSDSSTVSLSGGKLANATVQANIQAAGGALDGVTLAAGSTLTMPAQQSVAVYDGLTVNGTVDFTGSFDWLRFYGSQTLGGGGTVESTFTSGGTAPGLLTETNDTTLTLARGLNVTAGTMYIGPDTGGGTSSGSVINHTTITANSTGTLTLGGIATSTAPGFTNAADGTLQLNSATQNLTLAPSDWVNQGIIQATAGTLTLNGSWNNVGTINFSGGTLNLGGSFTVAGMGALTRSGGTVNLTGTLTNTGTTLTLDGGAGGLGSWQLAGKIVGGTVTTSNGAILQGAGGALDGVTLAAGSTLTMPAQQSVAVYDGLTVNGTVDFTGSFDWLRFYGSQTLGGGGTVESTYTGGGSSVPGLLTETNDTTLTLAKGLSVAGGSMYIGPDTGGSASNGAVVNHTTITANSTGTLTLGGIATSTAPGFTNAADGNIQLTSATETLALIDTGLLNQGLIQGSAGTLTINASNVVNSSTIQVSQGTLNLTATGLANTGTIQAPGGTLTFNGSWSNAGTITLANGTVNLGGTFKVADIGTLNRTNVTTYLTGTLDNTNTTLALDDTTGSLYLQGGTINHGTVTTAGSAELAVFTAGGTLNDVTLAGTLDVALVHAHLGPVNVTGGLTLDNGIIKLGGLNTLNFVGTQTLGGTGSVQLSALTGGNGIAVPNAGDALTVAANVPIHGDSGVLGTVGGGTLTINGTVASDSGGAITVQNCTNLAGGTLTGGTWQATGNGILRLLGSGIKTNAATIVLGGAGAHVYSDTGTTNAFAGPLTNTGTINVQDGAALATASLTQQGQLNLSNGGILAAGTYFQNSGTTALNGGLLGAPTPPPGSALSFNGSTDYVQLASRPVQNDFTIEFWLQSTQVAGSNGQWWRGMGLVDGEVSGVVNDFGVSLGAGQVLFGTGNPDSTIRSGFVADGLWHHVAVTRVQATGALTLYVDGQLVATGTASTLALTSPPDLRIGSLQTANNFFQGAIDDVRLWNVARTQAAILSDMTQRLTGTEANLVTYLPFDEGTGATAFDQTAHHNNGSLGGGVAAAEPAWIAVAPASFNLQGGTLSGPGTVTGNLTNAAAINLGSAPGTLTVKGNYTQTAAGALTVQVGGATAGSQYDQVNVSGTAALDGTLNADLVNGFGPGEGQAFAVLNAGAITGAFQTFNPAKVQGAPAFVLSATATGVSLIGATTAADLAVSNVTFSPTPAVVGQNVTVHYDVKNLGTVAATGPWTDSVYLSADGSLGPGAVLLGRVPENRTVVGLTDYSDSLTASVPGVVDGSYHVLVVADSGLQVPDVNRANNTAAAAVTLPVSVPQLPLGGQVSGTIASGQDVYYRTIIPPGHTVTFSAGFAVAVESEFALRYGTLPDRSAYDQATTDLTQLAPALTVNDTQGGSYYLLLHGREGAGAGQPYTLRAGDVQFEVADFSPQEGDNEGRVTVQLTGADFAPQTAVSLKALDGTTLTAQVVEFTDDTHLTVTFDLTGLSLGSYDLQATNGTNVVTAPGAFNVIHGIPGFVQVQIKSPQYVHVGAQGPVTVTLENHGDTDAIAPILVIGASGVTSSQSLEELLGGSDTLPGVVPPATADQPKQQVGFSYTLKPAEPHAVSNFQLGLVNPSTTPVDWASMKSALRPSYISADAWDAIWANFAPATGHTLANFFTLLDQDAAYLAQVGASTNSISRLIAFELQKANDALPVATLASTVDAAYPTPGLPLELGRAFLQPIAGRDRLGPFGLGWTFTWDISASTDSQGNVLIDQGGGNRHFTSDGNGKYSSDPGDSGTLTQVGGNYQLREVDGTLLVFLPSGQLSYIQDTNGNRITAEYSGSQLTALDHSSGARLTFAYNAQGRISQVTDPAGRVTTYAYDASGNHLLEATGPGGTTTYAYVTGQGIASENALQSITNPDGTHVFYGYDAQGRLTSQQGDDHASLITYTYFSPGGYQVTDADNVTVTILPDDSGSPGVLQDAQGNTTRFHYDADHQLVATSLPGDLTTTEATDRAGQVTRTTDAQGDQTNFAYNKTLEQLQSVTDGAGNTMSYTRDGQGNVQTITYADNSQAQFGYDSQGNLTQTVNQNGQATQNTYDNRGLLTRQQFADGSEIDYVYDAHGNLLSAAGPSGATKMEYDSADRLTKITEPNGHSLQFTYDAGGRRAQSVDQSGFTVNYHYDSAGRLAELTDATNAPIVKYSYDPAGRLERKDLGNGTYTTYGYDPDGRVIHLINSAPDGSVNSRFDYTYDALGRPLTMTTLTGQTSYGYDAAGRLTSVTLPGGRTITYQYDGAGNRISETDSGATTSYGINDLNQDVSVGAAANAYDADGNRTGTTGTGGATTYTYDSQNRLTDVTTPVGKWTYEYDALGNLIASTHNGQQTTYMTDPAGLGNVVGAYAADGSLIADYTYGLGLTSQVGAVGGPAFYDFDATGSTAGLSGTGGNYLDSYSYLPFGEILSATGTVANPFQYNGQFGVQAEGNGLNYMRARFYLPGEGRFLTADPLGIQGGVNRYAYAGNVPTTVGDPMGLDPAMDYNVTFSAIGAVSVGVYVEPDGSTSPYVGFGVATPGPSAAATYAPGGVTGGLSSAVTGNVPLLAMAGPAEVVGIDEQGNTSTEYGAAWGTPGAGGFVSYTFYHWTIDQGLPSSGGSTSPNPACEDDPELCWPDPLKGTGFYVSVMSPEPKAQDEPLFSFSPKQANSTSITQLGPDDPNFISGPAGFGSQAFVTPGVMPYDIGFENKATASAPAQVVQVTQQLDPNLDWSTFQLGDFGFGSYTVQVPAGRQYYSTRVDARATLGEYVDVTASINLQTGVVTWTFTTIDPTTLDVPAGDPLAGFLPPDDPAGDGEGFVNYTIEPKAGAATGTVINAQATVTFDAGLSDQSSLDTAPYSNTLDAGPPSSSVQPLPARETSTSFTVTWAGSDGSGGSGIGGFDIYVSDNGGSFTPWLQGTTQTSATFAGQDGHTYGFYSVATDNVGNSEALPTAAQATTTVQTETTPTVTATDAGGPYTGNKYQASATVLDGTNQDVSGQGTLSFTYYVGATVSGSGSAVAPSATGTCTVVAHFHSTNAGYTDADSAPATFMIAPVPLHVTADNKEISYGATLPPFTVSYSSFVPGEGPGALGGSLSFSGSAVGATSAGSYTITPGGLTSTNYTLSFISGTLLIDAVTPSVTATDAGGSYRGNAYSASATVSDGHGHDLSNQGTLSFTYHAGPTVSGSGSATPPTNAGTYTVVAHFHHTTDNVLDADSLPATFLITPVALAVTADNKEMTYGATLPAFTVSYSGFVPGEGPGMLGGSLSFSGSAVGAVNAGSYTITPSGLTSTNYVVSFGNGTLLIDPAPLKITPDDKTITVGSPVPTLTASYGGFVHGDTPASLTTPVKLTTTATGTSTAGDYPITASGASDANYTITYGTGTLQILATNSTTVQIEAAPSPSVYGQPVTFTVTVLPAAGSGPATGSVNLVDGGTPLATGLPLSNGQSVYTTALLGRGTHSITASFMAAGAGAGCVSAPWTQTVQTVALEPDPLAPTRKALAVGGTAGNDVIVVEASSQPNVLQIMVAETTPQTYFSTSTVSVSGVSHLLVYGGPGNDLILVDSRVTLPALLDGGPGDNEVLGGGGPSVLVGGAGRNILLGDSSRNILIGGGGPAILIPGIGQNVLIGGRTDYDANAAALLTLLQEWSRTDLDYNTRVNHLLSGGGLNGATVLSPATVHPDDGRSILLGGLGLELYFAGVGDLPFGKKKGEVVVEL